MKKNLTRVVAFVAGAGFGYGLLFFVRFMLGVLPHGGMW